MAQITSDIIQWYEAGETLSERDALYLNPSDNKVYKLDVTDDEKDQFFGITKDSADADDWIRVVQVGTIKGYTGLNVGEPVYASVTTPGDFQLDEPSPAELVVLGTAGRDGRLTINAALSAKTGGAGVGDSRLNLLEDGSFEFAADSDGGACTDCTFDQNDEVVLGTANNLNSLEIEFDDEAGNFVIDKEVSEEYNGQQVEVRGWIKTDLTSIKLIPRKNGVDAGIETQIASDGKWVQYALKFVADANATSVGFKIEAEDNETGSVYLDEFFLGASELSAIATRNCVGDLDCENTITFFYNLDGSGSVVDQFGNSYPVEKLSTNDQNKNIDITSLSLSSELRCTTATTRNSAGANFLTLRDDFSDYITNIYFTTRDAADNSNDYNGILSCTKTGADYKPDHERGVVTSDGNTDARLTVKHPPQGSDITIGNDTITVPFENTIDSNFIDWDAGNNEATFKKGGWYSIYYYITIINLSTGTGFETFIEVDSGDGFEQPDNTAVMGGQVDDSVARLPNHTGFEHIKVSSGDKMRLRVRGFHPDTRIFIRFNATLKMQIVPSVTGQQILGILKDIPDMPRADGEQPRFCTISQESDTSTPIFTSDNDCGDFTNAERTSEGLYGNIAFKDGFFKDGTTLRCTSSASRVNRSVGGPAAITAGSNIPPISGEVFFVDTRSISAGDTDDVAWNITCSGPRP